ncbi:hypothetical protein LOAG_12916, partial [Loa loa]
MSFYSRIDPPSAFSSCCMINLSIIIDANYVGRSSFVENKRSFTLAKHYRTADACFMDRIEQQ